MIYQPHAHRKERRYFRLTAENYKFLLKMAERRDESMALVLNSLLTCIRKSGIPLSEYQQAPDNNGSCQMTPQ